MDTEKLYDYLPLRIRALMLGLNPETASRIDEIRLRVGLPLSVTVGSRNLSVNDAGALCVPDAGVTVSADEMKECVSYLTKSSLYSYGETIRRGYIPIDGGARAGICGDAVTSSGEVRTFSDIRSVSLRVSRMYPSLAEPLCRRFREDGPSGTLVISPPGRGKTTYLRSAAYLLSRGKSPYRVGIADERYELFVPEMNGCLIDCVRGCQKKQAIDLLTRTMSPQIIVCDEISDTEAADIVSAQNSGVYLIGSCHGTDYAGVIRRPFVSEMITRGVFTRIVRLWYDGGYRSEIAECSELRSV